jgi:gliding motility-associated-like protein
LNLRSYILLLLSTLIGRIAFGQNIEFVENKGQWDNKVLFMGNVPSGTFYVHKDGFTVVQHNSDDWARLHEIVHDKGPHGNPNARTQDLILRSHAYTVDFVEGNPKAQVIADKPLNTYNNYFIGNDPSKWASNCKIYQGITIKDVYPNVDVRYYSDQGTMKYDLIVNPGGDVSRIAMRYKGVDKLEIKSRELVIRTSVGQLKELAPYTFQYRENGRANIGAKYSIKDNIVRFNIQDYDRKSTLIIDPTLIFCSLSGSAADNWGFTATYGPDGSMFGGGIVFSQGFPTSTGAYQTSFAGGSGNCFGNGVFDIGIIKLSPDGINRVYATYLGGTGNEMPQSLICDAQGELIVAGRTNSPNFPTTGGLIGPGGSWDIILTKLNAAGSGLVGSRRIGGSADDGANITPCGGGAQSLQQNYGDEARSEVNLDGAGNLYLASCTQSDNFPIQGGFQATKKGKQDGVVLKMTPDLSTLLFSTYLGGDGDDAAYVLSLRPSTGEIYVAGGTGSPNLNGAAAGTIGPVNHGAVDGFVSIISNDGSTLFKSTYLGTAGIDQVYGIQFDKFSFPYVMGQTTGAWPVLNATWSQPGGKQFIAKLQPDLSAFVYSTVFGKGAAVPDISPVAFLVDRCENVYVSGWGGQIAPSYNSAGAQGLPVTPDAIKSTADINPNNHLGSDFYFFVLEKNAKSQLYGSFFGQNGGTVGDHVDGGTSRFDRNGVIYQAICAACGNTIPFPTTPGAWATAKPASAASHCNLALVKIGFEFGGVASGLKSFINGVPGDTAGCVPLTVDFRDTLQQAVSYEWNFGDGSPQVTSTAPANSHTYNSVGVYRVMLVAIDSTTCNIRDTSYVHIRVGAAKALPDFNYKKVDPANCNSLLYQFDNTTLAPPGFSFTNQSFTWDFGDNSPRVKGGSASVTHSYAAPGTYKVRLILTDTTYCNAPDSIEKTLRVAALVKADFETPNTGCAPYNAVFENISAGGSQFSWDFGDGTTSTDVSPTHLYNAGTFTVTLTAIDSATCNKIDTKSVTITVYDNPVADFTAAPQPPTVNTPISFTNLSSADAVRFKWIFGDGDSLLTTSREVVQHEYNSTASFNACLVAINKAGCADTVCKKVSMLIEPALDVPNAFTPLSGDINSKVFVRGFGFAKLKFAIWARWGEKVFETNDKHIGWDGRYKGKVLPMDVYAYTVDVEFTDGTKASKKGDITLIR